MLNLSNLYSKIKLKRGNDMNIDEILIETEEKMEKAIENLNNRFKNIRAGRANPAILDGVKVNYYGAPTPLNQLATISVPEARKLQIKAFDKSCLSDIEKAIYEADLGLTPNNNGDLIFITIPELTEDRRKEFVKQAKTMAEEAKIALRNIRQDANSSLKKIEINEDEEKRATEEVQDLINKYNKKVDERLKEKEEELMTI
jgi:ribosome recycling factor